MNPALPCGLLLFPAIAAPEGVTLPFELVNQHILLKVTVGDSAPLSFVFDTGDKYGVIDIDRARELGLTLGGEVKIKGTSAESATGAFVTGASYKVAGLGGFTQPVSLAIPLKSLALRFGHDFDGILGADFIREFVVEIDYPARTIRLHDKDEFTYAGKGESLPLEFNGAGHPVIEAEVELRADEAVRGKFVVDLGAGGALTLNSPFVAEHHLPGPDAKSIRGIGSGGVGGDGSGRVGRVRALRIGKYALVGPSTFFSQDKAGAHAEADAFGSLGARAMSRFRVFLDYGRKRIHLEPNTAYAEPFDQATGGVLVAAEGAGYRTFRIREILEDSPATESGLRVDDVIESIDGRPASELSLTQILRMLELPRTYTLAIRRGNEALKVALTPRCMI